MDAQSLSNAVKRLKRSEQASPSRTVGTPTTTPNIEPSLKFFP
jgi:hypothetical protein